MSEPRTFGRGRSVIALGILFLSGCVELDPGVRGRLGLRLEGDAVSAHLSVADAHVFFCEPPVSWWERLKSWVGPSVAYAHGTFEDYAEDEGPTVLPSAVSVELSGTTVWFEEVPLPPDRYCRFELRLAPADVTDSAFSAAGATGSARILEPVRISGTLDAVQARDPGVLQLEWTLDADIVAEALEAGASGTRLAAWLRVAQSSSTVFEVDDD